MELPLDRKEKLLRQFRKNRAFRNSKSFTSFSELNIKIDPNAMRELK